MPPECAGPVETTPATASTTNGTIFLESLCMGLAFHFLREGERNIPPVQETEARKLPNAYDFWLVSDAINTERIRKTPTLSPITP